MRAGKELEESSRKVVLRPRTEAANALLWESKHP
jgi:hypothetical protein